MPPWKAVTSLALALICASCTRANPDFCDSGSCGEGFFCNLDRNACEPGICMPGVAESCSANLESLDVCAADGQGYDAVSCDFGCNEGRTECNECDPGASLCDVSGVVDELTICAEDGTLLDQRSCYLGCRNEGDSCIDVDPSNGLATDLDFIDDEPGLVEDLVLGDGFEVRADGSIRDGDGNVIPAINSREVSQGGDLPIRVFRVRSLTVEGAVTMTGGNPIAFVSDRDIMINGVVRVSAGRISDRGVNNCVGEDPSSSGGDDSGGGGGGFGRSGGNGGDADAATGGEGGAPHGTSELEPLVGGCDGGQGSGGLTLGGVGAGALQLVTRERLFFGASSGLDATGGAGGFEMVTGVASAASGGGSGGGLLLEAPIIDFESGAFISANGGGGGCANTSGERGRMDTMAAAGASCNAPAGDGGDGGSEDNTNADSGQDGSGTAATGGGGGGGVGRIRANTAIGQNVSSSFFSPSPSTGSVDTR